MYGLPIIFTKILKASWFLLPDVDSPAAETNNHFRDADDAGMSNESDNSGGYMFSFLWSNILVCQSPLKVR